MKYLTYSKLKIQDYFLDDKLSIEEKSIWFQYRTFMENFKLNFKNSYKSHECPLCGKHDDKAEESIFCEGIFKKEDPAFEFKEIFNDVMP